MEANLYQRIKEQVLQNIDLTPLEGKEVLLTGASGLLGSHILNILHGAGAKVFAVVQRGLPDYVAYLPWHTVYANLANPNDCERLPYADIVISAASYAQPLRFLAEPLLALRSSAYGLMALLERCRVGGRFMYISSSEVYCGCPDIPPYKEESIGHITPYHPRACYIQGKMFGEAIAYLYRNRGLSTVSVRPGIIYGPGFKRTDQRSWASFITRAIEQGKIELMDAGLVKRTFCYMADGMEMLFHALLYGDQPVYNIAGVASLTIAEVARVIGRAAGVPVIIPEVDHSAICRGVAGTPDNLELNIKRIKDEMYKFDCCFTSIEEGMADTVRWARGD